MSVDSTSCCIFHSDCNVLISCRYSPAVLPQCWIFGLLNQWLVSVELFFVEMVVFLGGLSFIHALLILIWPVCIICPFQLHPSTWFEKECLSNIYWSHLGPFINDLLLLQLRGDESKTIFFANFFIQDFYPWVYVRSLEGKMVSLLIVEALVELSILVEQERADAVGLCFTSYNCE